MDELLKSLYIKLDSTAESLTNDAIGQLLIKIIFTSSAAGCTKNEIIAQYIKLVKQDSSSEKITTILQKLVSANEVKNQRGRYYLSSTKKGKIEKSLLESKERIEYILDKYFVQLYSSRDIIRKWLEDVMLKFFELYSRNWVSDLCYHKNDVDSKIDDIKGVIEKRTQNFDGIDVRDYKRLSVAFSKMFTERDPKVDELLWEYGTSQFSAQLVAKGNAADKITLDTFSGAYCILDTNILMHIGLEASEYYKHLSSLERVFEKLHISVGILYITQKEYENTITCKSKDVIRLFDAYKIEVLEKASDQYILTAKKRGCKTIEDYARFFDQLKNVPSYIDKSLKIELLDDDVQIANAIDSAQHNDEKLARLNNIYKSVVGHDKRQSALLHDVGMIEGVNELRKKGKYFILSQESSVNGYAKLSPSEHNLPIAVKIETLINVLAINSYNINTDDYIPLFASIIRNSLQPNRETFKITDLSYILEKNEQISQLSPESTIKIAQDVHRRRLLGESDEELQKEMTRMLQGEKIKAVTDLETTKQKLSLEQEECKRLQRESEKTREALEEKWTKDAKSEINRSIIIWSLYAFLLIPLAAFALWMAVYHCFDFIKDRTEIISSIIIDILLAILIETPKIFPKWLHLVMNRKQHIEKIVQQQRNEFDNNG